MGSGWLLYCTYVARPAGATGVRTPAATAVEALAGQERPSHLAVCSNLDGDEVVMTVEDSGPGVDAAVRSRIFDPFFTTKSDGSGIGLSMCQRIVTDHGGSLEVGTSRWGGAAFSVRMPLPGTQHTGARKEQQCG